jgi:hypothetical protein
MPWGWKRLAGRVVKDGFVFFCEQHHVGSMRRRAEGKKSNIGAPSAMMVYLRLQNAGTAACAHAHVKTTVWILPCCSTRSVAAHGPFY